MSRPIGRATVGMAILASVALTGCSPSPSPDQAPYRAGGTASPTAGADPVLDNPLQAYRLSVTELTTINQARSIVIGECMARLGFDFPVRTFEEELTENRYGEQLSISRLYGITDRSVAERYGYGRPAERPSTTTLDQQSPAELLALKGRRLSPGGKPVADMDIPEGGCVGEADRLFESDPDVSPYGLGHTLWVQAMSTLQGSDDYVKATEVWSRCLAERGYRVTAPLNDQGDIKRLSGAGSAQGTATPAEIELALADIDCKDKVDLVGRLNAAGATIARTLIEQHQLALEDDRTRLDRQLRRATDLVAER